MPILALQGWVHIINPPNPWYTSGMSVTRISSAFKATTCLAPVYKKFLHSQHRRHASVGTRVGDITRYVDGFAYGKSGLPIELEYLLSPNRRLREAEWTAIVDSYLPLELRGKNQQVSDGQPSSADAPPIATLPRVLTKVREQSKIDIMSYMGVYQGRWDAVMWLVRAMSEYYRGRTQIEQQSERLFKMLWPSDGHTLEVLTGKPIEVGSPGMARISLDSVMHENDENVIDGSMLLSQRNFGQIWQSLATMILQAADRSADDPKYSLIMTQVFRILGYLHRIDAFPNLIYNYSLPADQTVLQRPPTLYLLSRRIMSTLSDIEFDIQWKEERLKYQEQGYELANTAIAPKVREFGPELWLDIVLWACVEGGWIMEGTWIIGEMERRKTSPETRWSVISWEEICTKTEPTLDWPSILRLQIDRTRLNQVGSIGIATGSDSTVDMGTRTISREVVLALMDGLLNIVPSNTTGAGFYAIQEGVLNCKNIIQRGRLSPDSTPLNTSVLRMIETTGANEAPGTLQRILDTRITAAAKNAAPSQGQLPAPVADSNEIAAILGLHHRNLYSFAEGGNLQGSLNTFRNIQAIIDIQRSQHISEFANKIKQYLQVAEDSENTFVAINADRTSAISPQIPVSALSAFVNLITESKLYDVGEWLLKNEDIDGGIVDPKLYSDRNLQPALLRFATATADDTFLTKILANVEPPIPEPSLHALLCCQIVLGKFSAVEELLSYIKKTPGMSWKASDAMTIARTILLLEHRPHTAQIKDRISQAQNVLRDLLQGKYNAKRDLSRLPDLSQAKLAVQLGRIFKSLKNSGLKTLVPETPTGINRANASVTIEPDAFNILLETVVECSGPYAGRKLWRRWCQEPIETTPKSTPTINHVNHRTYLPIPPSDPESEKIVTPTRHMLRNILRPILKIRQPPTRPNPTTQESTQQKVPNPQTAKTQSVPNPPGPEENNPDPQSVKRELTPEEQDILDWGIGMYRKFGLNAKEINSEIPQAILWR